ncbi:MAG: ATP synthase F1 subunit delta [Chloroflexi bacterium]|nr:ATP synthase F1 subunit delta [Chloroflexota bacterium]
MSSATMERTEIARKYAQAAYESALSSWLRRLSAVRQALTTHPDVREKLNSSASFTERRKALDEILPDDVGEDVRNFLYVLLKDGRIDLLDEVIIEFEHMARRGPEARIARVISAVPLTEEEKEQLRERLIKRFGGDLEFDFRVDPQILGGVIVKVGDEVIDGSLASKLAAMRAQLTRAL